MECDIAIAGGGISGNSIAYWLSEILDARIIVLEKNNGVGLEASSRNTGNQHRPFYLDPLERKKFAVSANLGYEMFGKIARREDLPWKQVGTLEVAINDHQMKNLEKYMEWGIKNGMKEEELELLGSGEQVKELAPVECVGALLCKTDTAVDFGAFTRCIRDYAENNNVKFLLNKEVSDFKYKKDIVDVYVKGEQVPIRAKLFVNCAGGNAVDIAHKCGLGLEYTDLHFRGDYWIVHPEFGKKFKHNIYTVPEHQKFQFLDPHLIIRVDDRYEIGPSAIPVAGPENYENFGFLKAPSKFLERPVTNKLRLVANPEFLRLASNELRHMLRKGLVRRMKKFIPSLRSQHIVGKGKPGIRHSLIAPDGSFVPEAVQLSNALSYHVVNYISPGASGSLAYAAYLVNDMVERGLMSRFRRIPQRAGLFDFDKVVRSF